MGTGEVCGRLAVLVVLIGLAAVGLVVCGAPEQPPSVFRTALGWAMFGVGVSCMALVALDTLCQLRKGRGPRNGPDA
jgi:hypothetical protein